MQYRRLGRTGLKVSVIGYGGIKLPNVSEAVACHAISRAVDLGVNFIDTARNYGDSEHKIGVAIEGRRDECFVATKTASRDYRGAMRDLETSLTELQTDYLDLWQLHNVCNRDRWEKVMSPNGALKAAREAKEEGRAKHIGITIHRALGVMRKAIECGEFETIMVLYNPLDEEDTGKEIIPLAHKHGMGVIVMKSLSGGSLALPLSDQERQERHESSGGEWYDPLVRGSLRFVASNPGVSTVIPGMRFAREVEENVKVGDQPPLTEEEKSALIEKIGELKKTYKYGQQCLRCGYCLEVCPQSIPIPDVLRAVYVYQKYPEETRHMGMDLYRSLETSPEECTECESCVEECPAEIEIPARLKEAVEVFSNI